MIRREATGEISMGEFALGIASTTDPVNLQNQLVSRNAKIELITELLTKDLECDSSDKAQSSAASL